MSCLTVKLFLYINHNFRFMLNSLHQLEYSVDGLRTNDWKHLYCLACHSRYIHGVSWTCLKEQIFSAKSAGVTKTMQMFSLIGVFAPYYNEIYGATELTCHKECPSSLNGSIDAGSCFRHYFMQKMAYILTLFPVERSLGKMLRARWRGKPFTYPR